MPLRREVRLEGKDYLLNDADCRALVYHARFAPVLQSIRTELPHLDLLIQVADKSGNPLLPGALDYEAALRQASATRPNLSWSDDDLYIVYTGGTTGMPKGVLWRQADIFFAAMGGHVPGQPPVASLDEVVSRSSYGDLNRTLPAPPFMHNAGHWTAFITLHQGGTVVVQHETRRLDPDDIWRTVELLYRNRVVCCKEIYFSLQGSSHLL